MNVRVIIHPASDDGWDVYIQGDPDPVHVATMADLNDVIADRGIGGCLFYPWQAGCAAGACDYAATGTVLWKVNGVYHVLRACESHEDEAAEDAARLAGSPYVFLPEVIPLPRAAYSSASVEDMAEFARGLVGVDVPGEVYAQPACARCKKRICMEAGNVQWVTADGQPECRVGKQTGNHVLDVPPDTGGNAETTADSPEPLATSAH